MEQALLPFKRYAEFDGRSTRTEYFAFSLLNFCVYLFLFILLFSGIDYGSTQVSGFTFIGLMMMLLYALGTFIPSMAVTVRRLHDQNKTGWLVLLSFIPYIGGLILLILMFLPGDDGQNQYGPNPR